MGITTQIIGLLASLAFLVFTHELGHFCFARIFHTRVDKFYLFFNPGFSILRMKRYEGKRHFSFFSKNSPKEWAEHPESTEWGIGWLPLGGYCAINGMVDETTKPGDLPEDPQPYEFRSKPAWQRLFIILGGVLVNFISALVIYSAVLFTWGESYIPMENAKYGLQFSEIARDLGFQNGDQIVSIDGKTVKTIGDFTFAMLLDNPKQVVVSRNREKFAIAIPKDFARTVLQNEGKGFCDYNFPYVIDSVIPQEPAALAGLQRGDSLVGINEDSMFLYGDYVSYLSSHKNGEITLNIIRNDSLLSIPMTVNENGKMGVYPKRYVDLEIKTVKYGFFESIPSGIAYGIDKLGSYIKQFRLFKYKEGAASLGGFGTIGSIFPKTWDWWQFWTMTGFLAIALAFMNFLPIPALDGGYFLFILIEMITRRKPSDKFIGYANTVGFALLLLLLLYANGMDIYRAFFK